MLDLILRFIVFIEARIGVDREVTDPDHAILLPRIEVLVESHDPTSEVALAVTETDIDVVYSDTADEAGVYSIAVSVLVLVVPIAPLGAIGSEPTTVLELELAVEGAAFDDYDVAELVPRVVKDVAEVADIVLSSWHSHISILPVPKLHEQRRGKHGGG